LIKRAVALGLVLILSLGLIYGTQTFDSQFADATILRDHTATVLTSGKGFNRRLLINGVGITMLTPITKMMAAMPLSFLDRPPEKALVICFGMGTTHRSMLSWGIDSTAVELVPSVPKVFHYFHADGDQLLQSPKSHVVIDDGRRFLERTNEQFDVIAIDPPPPVQAAGSSLLYSAEFYSVAKKRLRPDGILAQWLPDGDPMAAASVAKALKTSFPYVRVFISIEGWGLHFLASKQPIPHHTAAELASRMPTAAVMDLVEWGPYHNAEQQLAAVLGRELPIDQVVAQAPHYPALRDDRPVNEYYALRWFGLWLAQGKWNPPDPRPH
jgi:spermidine synthase